MELKEAAACKIQTAAPTSWLALFQNVLYKGYTLKLRTRGFFIMFRALRLTQATAFLAPRVPPFVHRGRFAQ